MKSIKTLMLITVGSLMAFQQAYAGSPGGFPPENVPVPEIDGAGAVIAIGLVVGLVALIREKFHKL